MHLTSFRTPAFGEGLGLVLDGLWAPAVDLLPDGPSSMTELLAAGPAGVSALAAAADPGRIKKLGKSIDRLVWRAPVPRPGNIVAVGRNYRDHTADEGAQPPDAPLIFSKWPSSVIAHDEEITWSRSLTAAVDYEAELAVVIGLEARDITPSDALTFVLGYTCLNDVSARDLQFEDGQWTRGKSLDTFCPMGPVLVTRDEIPDPQRLRIECQVNEQTMQRASTADMFFTVTEIISHCSRAFTLEPGDVIATGTPAGVGYFRDPKTLLDDGDTVVVAIEGIGRLVNRCRVTP